MTFRGQPRVDTSDESSQFTIPVVRIGGDRARSPDSERGNLPSVSVFCVIRGALRITKPKTAVVSIPLTGLKP